MMDKIRQLWVELYPTEPIYVITEKICRQKMEAELTKHVGLKWSLATYPQYQVFFKPVSGGDTFSSPSSLNLATAYLQGCKEIMSRTAKFKVGDGVVVLAVSGYIPAKIKSHCFKEGKHIYTCATSNSDIHLEQGMIDTAEDYFKSL